MKLACFHWHLGGESMAQRRLFNGIWLLVVMAFGGLLLVTVPPWIAEQLETVSQAGPLWAKIYLAVVGTGAVLLIAASGIIVVRLWSRTRAKRQRRERQQRSPSELTAAERQAELQDNLAAVAQLQQDLAPDDPLRKELDPLQNRLSEKQTRQKLEIVAFGSISGGKSSVLNALAGRDVFPTDPRGGTTLQRNEIPWPGKDQVVLVDTPGLGEVGGAARGQVSAEAARDADLVLLVVDGPLRDYEVTLLKQLTDMEKRVLVCLNKEDWFEPSDRDALLNQIHQQIGQYVPRDDIVSIRSQTTRRPRVVVQPDGGQREEWVDEPPDIEPLARRMLQIIQRDGRDLLLANLLLQSRGLVDEARRKVQDRLDERAREIVERYTWGAAGAAALSPLPVVDLIAGCAISSKMVVELARVYHQEMDLDTALTLLKQLGKNLVAILGVSAATPAVTSAVASLLKAVPGAGTLAGGVLQGLVQALITRWIGAVFMEYFKNEMREPPGGFASLARRQWEQLTTVDQLRQLLQTSRKQLSKATTQDDRVPSRE